jgi:hypothetical protein
MAQSPDTATISLRVPATLAAELKAISAKQRRPLSQMCVFLIEAKLRELQCVDAFAKPFLPDSDQDD